MLAILQVKMQWSKESRTPTASAQRKNYYKPVLIEEEVPLSGDGIFMKKCEYFQYGNDISYQIKTSEQLDQLLYDKNVGQAFTGMQECEYKMALRRNQSTQHTKGAFYTIDELTIPCIEIIEEPNACYRIKWFDSKRGMPRRRWGNEDLYKKGTRLAGNANILNETACILKAEEASVLKYNYRLTSFHGQWYEYYVVYFVNTNHLTRDIFLREYNYEYNQLADLF